MITDDNYEPIAKPVDVICMHSAKGEITPIRIRVVNEEGEYQVFNIKGFNDLSHHGARTMPDGVSVTNNTLIYDCRIHVLNRERRVMLYYDPYKMEWRISTG